MPESIAVGDMGAYPSRGESPVYIAGRVTRVLPGGWLVKSTAGVLSRETILLPMRNDAESESAIRAILGLPTPK